MSADDEGPVYSPSEVKDRIGRGVSLGKVYLLLKTGELGHYRIGDTYHIRGTDLEDYLSRAYVPAKPGGVPRDDDTAAPPRSNPTQERVA